MSDNKKEESCEQLAHEDIVKSLYEYIELCKNDAGAKQKGRFPNPAGFCRHLGISLERLSKLLDNSPEEYGVLSAVFEDEALNSDLSATVITAYLKQRLGYGEKQEAKSSSFELPEVKLVFDHDIFEDGG